MKIVERESQSATDWFKENNMVVNSEKVRGKGGERMECALCRSPWLAGEENVRFQMVNVGNYKFLTKYFYQYFQILSVFTDKILSIFQDLLTL